MPDAPAGTRVCVPAQAAGFRICARTQDRFIDAQIVINHPCAGVSGHLASEANQSTPDSDIVMNLGLPSPRIPWVTAGRELSARLAPRAGFMPAPPGGGD